jgi:RNA polymerase sigma-70 factor (ECF subfamily)
MSRSRGLDGTDDLPMVVSSAARVASAPSDTSLIEAALRGEEQAYSTLYRRHASHIAGVVARILGGDADLDDIVQDTFVLAFRQLDRVTDPTRMRSFLITIAVRRVHARLSLRYRARDLVAQLLGVASRVSDPAVDEPAREVGRLLGSVALRHRIVWVLHRVEGYTLPEVAEQSGASLASVKRWIAAVDGKIEVLDAPR